MTNRTNCPGLSEMPVRDFLKSLSATYRNCCPGLSETRKHIAQRRKPARARQDIALKPEIARVFAENFAVCCVRKVWRQTMRKGFPIARCTVARLMREMAWRRNPWPAGAYDQAMASASTCGTQGQGLQPASLPFLLRRYQLRPTRHEFSHSYKQWARRL